MERELVHHADDAAIVRRGDPYVAHGLALRGQERLVDTVPPQDRFDRGGARSSRVAAGASSMNTGSSVRLLTSSATWGRQNRALANQSPSAVVDSSGSATGAPFTRSRSFLVPRMNSTGASLASARRPLGQEGFFYRNFYRTG